MLWNVEGSGRGLICVCSKIACLLVTVENHTEPRRSLFKLRFVFERPQYEASPL